MDSTKYIPTHGVELWKNVRGMHMHHKERLFLIELAKSIESKFEQPTIVNIGIAANYGYCSMLCLREGAPNARIIGIDIEEQGDVPDVLGPNTEFVIGDSGELWRDYLDEKIHMVFVDGDHAEKGVTRDIFGWAPSVECDGYIAFHDYGHYGKRGFEHVYGVRRAVDKNIQIGIWKLIGDVVSIRAFKRTC